MPLKYLSCKQLLKHCCSWFNSRKSVAYLQRWNNLTHFNPVQQNAVKSQWVSIDWSSSGTRSNIAIRKAGFIYMGASPADIDILPMWLVLVDVLVFSCSLRCHWTAVSVRNVPIFIRGLILYQFMSIQCSQ